MSGVPSCTFVPSVANDFSHCWGKGAAVPEDPASECESVCAKLKKQLCCRDQGNCFQALIGDQSWHSICNYLDSVPPARGEFFALGQT